MQCDTSEFPEETRNQPYKGWYYQQDKFFPSKEYSIKQTYEQQRLFLFHGKCWWYCQSV